MTKRTSSPTSQSQTLRNYVLLAMFVAIIFLLGMTPIGLISLPFIKATTMHVPVIIGSVLLGPKRGAVLGFCFGVVSIITNTMAPAALSFCFSPLAPVPGLDRGSLWALVICFVPRILVGVVPWFIYKGTRMLFSRETHAVRGGQLVVAGFVGSMVNTLLVMGLIGAVFTDAFALLKGIPTTAVSAAIMGIVVSSGVPEAIVAAVLTPAVVIPLQKLMKQDPLKGQAPSVSVATAPSAEGNPSVGP